MTAIPYAPNLPSPTNRDSAASAIFNLYDYSTRDSVIGAANKAEIHGIQSGLHGGAKQNGFESHSGEQTEELQSPRVAEDSFNKTRSRTSSQRSRRASSIVHASNGMAHGETYTSGAVNGVDFPAQSHVALGTPVAGGSSVTHGVHLESPQHNDVATDGILQKVASQDVPNRHSTTRSVHSQQSQRSLSHFEPSGQSANGDNGDRNRTQSSYQQRAVKKEGLQLPGPTELPQPQSLSARRPSTSLTKFTSTRQPGEEEDAYHVRATYARLEVQGVFGDGWEEGVERTRERAVVSKRRESRAPMARGDILVEEERKALATVDR